LDRLPLSFRLADEAVGATASEVRAEHATNNNFRVNGFPYGFTGIVNVASYLIQIAVTI
jgi:hypothetical protein